MDLREAHREAMAVYTSLVDRSSREIGDVLIHYVDVSHGKYVGAFMLLSTIAIREGTLADQINFLVEKGRLVSKRESFPAERIEYAAATVIAMGTPSPEDLFALWSMFTRDELENIGI
jgi:hypothetical protein